jgi:DNA-3-methyladenine glycosylase
MKLKKDFYNRSTLVVAKELLGKYLIRKIGNKIIAARITETEAYHGPNDLASHASKGKTPRTSVMFGPAGYSYVYLIYGMYHCFNIVTGKENYPSAVLIRAAGDMKGPGILCRELKIDKTLNNVDLTTSKELWLEDRGSHQGKIKKTKRVGVDYAKEYKDKLWRFVLESK